VIEQTSEPGPARHARLDQCGDHVGREEWALRQGDVLADWCNVAGGALKALMDAYEHRIRSNCTPEQIKLEPWRCAPFIMAERALASKPVPVVSIDASGVPACAECGALPDEKCVHQVNRWISVGERMPLTPYEDEAKRHVESDRLLVVDSSGVRQIATAIQYSDGEYCWCLGGFPGADMTVTHWMPLPDFVHVACTKQEGP
jgi:hypothetical protein